MSEGCRRVFNHKPPKEQVPIRPLERISQVEETAAGHNLWRERMNNVTKGESSIELNSQVKGQRRAEKISLALSVLFVVPVIH